MPIYVIRTEDEDYRIECDMARVEDGVLSLWGIDNGALILRAVFPMLAVLAAALEEIMPAVDMSGSDDFGDIPPDAVRN
jgi:hypothetical protein